MTTATAMELSVLRYLQAYDKIRYNRDSYLTAVTIAHRLQLTRGSVTPLRSLREKGFATLTGIVWNITPAGTEYLESYNKQQNTIAATAETVDGVTQEPKS